MKILYISNEYPPQTGNGGIGTYTFHMAAEMARRGHRTHVICRSVSGNAEDFREGTLTVHRTPAGTYPLPSSRMWYPVRALSYRAIPHFLDRLAWASQVRKRIDSLGIAFDIVESPECGAEGYFVQAAQSVTHIVRLHTPWTMVKGLDNIQESRLDTRLIGAVERSTARHATLVTAPSEAMAQRLKSTWRLRTTPTIVPNPLPHAQFAQASGDHWAFIGRVEYRKGVHVLLDAYEKALSQTSLPRLRLVGRPYGHFGKTQSYEQVIRQKLKNPALQSKVEWIEGTDSQGVRDILTGSWAVFLPSLWENCPYSCLEAMAAGCAVVASDSGGFPEIITSGSDGTLVSPEDSDALADTMVEMARHPDRARQLGIQATRTIRERFDSTIVGDQMEELYRSVAKE